MGHNQFWDVYDLAKRREEIGMHNYTELVKQKLLELKNLEVS
jgi:hypothetical protein